LAGTCKDFQQTWLVLQQGNEIDAVIQPAGINLQYSSGIRGFCWANWLTVDILPFGGRPVKTHRFLTRKDIPITGKKLNSRFTNQHSRWFVIKEPLSITNFQTF
jgi:hypothetical protein